jgi:hypothetical protein
MNWATGFYGKVNPKISEACFRKQLPFKGIAGEPI